MPSFSNVPRAQPIRLFVRRSMAMLVTAMVFAFVLPCFIFPFRKMWPLNLILLGLFTLVMSYMVGTVCTYYSSKVVMQTVIVTTAVVFALSMLVFFTRWDFSFLWGFLIAATLVLLIAGIIQIFFPFGGPLYYVYCSAGALIFSLWVLYDTDRISKTKDPDEWVEGALSLYLVSRA